MKAFTNRLLAGVTTLTILGACGSALAVEGGTPTALPNLDPSDSPVTISVQLDGKNLTFTDALPVARDGRAFLPFRAICEAMGAQVGYDAAANQITATRGGVQVAMTLGSAEATVTRDGKSEALIMDAAPYAADNHTYVPVRFAAQALGCTVGWDSNDSTVILVDTEKLLESTLAKYKFTYMDQYADYTQRYQDSIWDVDAAYEGSVTIWGARPLTMTGTLDGVSAGATQLEAAMTFKMDAQDFMEDMSGLFLHSSVSMTADQQALLDALRDKGVAASLRGDLEDGALYLALSGETWESLGLPADVWYSMDLSAFYDQMGLNYGALMDASKTLDAAKLLDAALQNVTLTDKDTAYQSISSLVDGAAKFLSDSSFVENGHDRTTTYTLEEDGAKLAVSFTLTTDGGKVVGYGMEMSLAADLDDGSGSPVSTEFMRLSSGMDAGNHMTTSIKLGIPALMDVSLSMSGDFVPGDKAPQTQPPTGATVIPYEQLMDGLTA